MTTSNTTEVRLAAIVVVYFPDSDLVDNIVSYMGVVKNIYIYQNSFLSTDTKEKLLRASNVNINFLGEGINQGVAYALNQGCKKAKLDGYLWALTMDQDSSFVAIHQSHIECVKDAGMYYPVCQLGGGVEDNQTPPWVLTSGNIISLPIWEDMGGFNDELFIDGVDFEYCIRLLDMQKKIERIPDLHMAHSLGEGVEYRKILFFRVRVMNHKPIRMFYISRNYIRIAITCFSKHPIWSLYILRVLILRLVKLVFVNADKWSSIKMAIKGLYAAARGRYGAYESHW